MASLSSGGNTPELMNKDKLEENVDIISDEV
jgi:hypothetical protein